MKKLLLTSAGVGGILAVAGGFLGLPFLFRIGAPLMLISLLILPWVRETEPPDSGNPSRFP